MLLMSMLMLAEELAEMEVMVEKQELQERSRCWVILESRQTMFQSQDNQELEAFLEEVAGEGFTKSTTLDTSKIKLQKKMVLDVKLLNHFRRIQDKNIFWVTGCTNMQQTLYEGYGYTPSEEDCTGKDGLPGKNGREACF